MTKSKWVCLLVLAAAACKHLSKTPIPTSNKYSEDVIPASPTVTVGSKLIPTGASINKLTYSLSGGVTALFEEKYSLSFDNSSLSAVWRKVLASNQWGESTSTQTLKSEELAALKISFASLVALTPPASACQSQDGVANDSSSSRFILTYTDSSHISKTISIASQGSEDCADGYISSDLFQSSRAALEAKLPPPQDDSAYTPLSN